MIDSFDIVEATERMYQNIIELGSEDIRVYHSLFESGILDQVLEVKQTLKECRLNDSYPKNIKMSRENLKSYLEVVKILWKLELIAKSVCMLFDGFDTGLRQIKSLEVQILLEVYESIKYEVSYLISRLPYDDPISVYF